MKLWQSLFRKEPEESFSPTTIEEQKESVIKQEKLKSSKIDYKRIKSSKNWLQFMPNLITRLADAKTPELVLCFKSVSMAENLLKYRPEKTKSLITEEPEIIEFPNGNGATCFILSDISKINQLVNFLFLGPFDENLFLINGLVAGLPQSKHASFLGTIGVAEGIHVENILTW